MTGYKVIFDMDMKEEITELKANSQMNEKKIQALINILAKEGVISRDDFDNEFDSL